MKLRDKAYILQVLDDIAIDLIVECKCNTAKKETCLLCNGARALQDVVSDLEKEFRNAIAV